MDWMKSFSIDQLQWGYILVVVLLAAIVFAIGWKRKDVDADRVAQVMDWFDAQGIGVVYQIIAFFGIACLAWIGWRLPAEIDNLSLDLTPHLEAFPRADTTVGRLGQCVGALGFALIAIRSMRFIIPIMTGMLVIVGLLLGYHYIGYRF